MKGSALRCTLIRGGRLYTPEDSGINDILVIGERIALIGKGLAPPRELESEVINASGKVITPGFIDLHVHLLGGGGENGPRSHVPEITLSTLTTAGITTVVGVIGTDSITRTPTALLTKVKALRAEGLSVYMYTGAYHFPSTAITGSVTRDIALIDEVIEVKIAISDHRSSQPIVSELARLASEARTGGMLGEKPGILHVHVGTGKRGLSPLIQVVEKTEIPISQFLPTHIARTPALLKEGGDRVHQEGRSDRHHCTISSGEIYFSDRKTR